jgi:predicted Zn-dependent peptidase
MKRYRNSRFEKFAAGGLLTLALVAAALVAGTSDAPAQVKDWKKIKFPTLRPFEIPEPERYEMSNGMVVLLMEDHELPLIEISARIRTGSRLVPAEKAGLASVTGAVLRTGGAGSRTGDEIDDFLDARGAEIETGIGASSGRAGVSCLKDDFPQILGVFADMLRRPRFEQSKMDVATTQEKAAIARRNDQQMGIMFREGRRLVYGSESPYALNTEYDTIDAITQADLGTFHAKHFVPNRVYLGVVGDFKSAEMKKMLEMAFGDWKRGPEAKDPQAAYRTEPQPGIYYIDKQDVTQSAIIMGHLGIRQDNPDYFAAEVLNHVLSGSSSSRLFNNIRTEKGLAYAVTGRLGANFDYPGTFTVWMTTKTESTAASIDALLEELDALVAAAPTEEEMELAMDSMLNSFIFNYDTKSEILEQQLTYEYYGYPADFLATYRRNIEKVTADDVLNVAKKYVHKENLAILVVGKQEGLDRPLETFGQVATVDITIPEPSAAGAAVAAVPGMSEAEAKTKGGEVLTRMIDAAGGEARIDAVESLRIVGEMSIKTPAGEMAIQGTHEFVLPDRIRQEMQTPMGQISMVITPDDAFVNTPMGVQPLPGSQRDDMLKTMRRTSLVLLKNRTDPAFDVRYAGKETVEGVECELIGITYADESVLFAVDPSGRVLKTSHRGTGPQGVPGEIVTLHSDYREADGLWFPFKEQTLFDGEPAGSTVVQEISVNHQVDEAMFARPDEAKAAAPAEAQ